MPNLYTHVCFGKEVANALTAEAAEAVNADKAAYDLGCTGPDFLFILRETGIGKVPEYAEKMHTEHVYDVFRALAEALDKNRNPVKLAYAMGLMCHYVLDFTLHPYVFETVKRYSNELLPPAYARSAHHFIESAVDEYYISELGMGNAHEFETGRTAKEEISALYTEVINPVFGEKLGKRSCITAFNLIKKALKFSRDAKGVNLKTVRFLEKILLKGAPKFSSLIHPPYGYGESDYLNYAHRPFRKVRNEEEEERADVPQLLKRALKRAVVYLTEFFRAARGETVLDREKFRINYEGCSVTP